MDAGQIPGFPYDLLNSRVDAHGRTIYIINKEKTENAANFSFL